MNSDVKNTIREALDAMKLAARYSTVLSRDEDEYREAMQQAEAIAVRADAALAALDEQPTPQPAIPPDVRETLRGALQLSGGYLSGDIPPYSSKWGLTDIDAALSWLDAQGGTT